jgi:membrane protease YdiL (CAAX protease family)
MNPAVGQTENLAYIRSVLILLSALLSYLAIISAERWNYFRNVSLFTSTVAPRLAGKIFLLFIFLQLVFFPLIFSLGFSLSGISQGWLNLMNIAAVTLVLFAYCYQHRKYLRFLFRSQHLGFDILLGALSWLLAYPIVLCISQILTLILSDWAGFSLVDQLAVKQIRNVMQFKDLFIATLVAVIGIIPFLEEFLFRGVLQSALRNYFPAGPSILISSLIFTLFHFSIVQGINNINILGSLFILALFLGFLRERQNNIWSSFALHALFNAVSITMIFLNIDI